MPNWILHPTTLTGQTVDLIPLEQVHFAELEILAKDPKIWEFYPSDNSNAATFSTSYNLALSEREKGTQYPFVIFHKKDNKIIGSTRYIDIHPKDRKLEIGYTWLDPNYWATEVNFECKLLLLTHCFETIKTVRVQLKTDENNIRSRRAIEKIGGQFEGILRKDRLRDNNTYRNTAFFSILDTEWNDKKLKLAESYKAKRSQNN